MDEELVVVFKGSVQQADLVKGLLEEAGIQAFLDNENIATTFPPVSGALGSAGGRVAVGEHDKERAEQVIAEAHDSGAD